MSSRPTPAMADLFGDPSALPFEDLAPGAAVLRGRALASEAGLLAGLEAVETAAPFRHMATPGGFTLSVAMTNCGRVGWVTDRRGYRYEPEDPQTGRPWPAMPDAFLALARAAATEAGYPAFEPDACLVNRYAPGARMGLHQDKDERDADNPIVSVSLGLPAWFQFGGLSRKDPVRRVLLRHGDLIVWGGHSRLAFHGVLALKDGDHPLLGRKRINLTFRRAL